MRGYRQPLSVPAGPDIGIATIPLLAVCRDVVGARMDNCRHALHKIGNDVLLRASKICSAGLSLLLLANLSAAAQRDHADTEAGRIAEFNRVVAAQAQQHLAMYKAGHFEELDATAIGWTIITGDLCGVGTKALNDAIHNAMARASRENFEGYNFALLYGMGLRGNRDFPISPDDCQGLDRAIRGLTASILAQ